MLLAAATLLAHQVAASSPSTGAAPALFPLIEASGVEPFAAPGWELGVAGAGLCGDDAGSAGMLLVSSTSGAVLVAGPTPHAVATDAGKFPAGGQPWVAGAAVGHRVWLFRSVSTTATAAQAAPVEVAMVTVAPNCSGLASFTGLQPAQTPGEWVAAAALPTGGVAALRRSRTGDEASLIIYAADGSGVTTAAIAVAPAAGCVWVALAATSNGTLVAARDCTARATHSSGDQTATVIELRRDGTVLSQLNVSIDGHSDWAGVAAADIEGDGCEQVLLARRGNGTESNTARVAVLFRSPTSAGALQRGVDAEFDGMSQRWLSFGATRWLNGSGSQLVALRAYDPALSGREQAVNVLVYGSASHVLPRRAALVHTLGQQELNERFLNFSSDVDKFNTSYFLGLMSETHTNSHLFEVCQQRTYTNLISLLANSSNFAVDGMQFRVWSNLLPPTEAYPKGDVCQAPPDDPRTEFNETALFNMSFAAYSPEEKVMRTFAYWDYAAWAEVFGRLAAQFPHLVAMSIDDFTHDVAPPHGLFTPQLLAEIVNSLHTHSPTINFAPLVYYSESVPVFQQWPDLSLIGDGLAFYFRNQKQGAGPCAAAACVWGPSGHERAGGCLAGACAEPTVANVGDEVRDIRAWLPPGRPLVVGFYATGHSSLGSPSARYVRELLPTILSQPDVQGAMVFTMLAPCGGAGPDALPSTPVCAGNFNVHDFEIEFCAKGCAIRDAYAAASLSRGRRLL